MCGIYGIVALEGPLPPDRTPYTRMGDALRHRGPDGRRDIRAGDGWLGATRLRVIDPTPAGDQPFEAPAGRGVLVANGEVYNAQHLRAQHPSFPYRSHTDVECLLPLLLRRGAEGLADVDGMFAAALWEPSRRRLTLARDRAGEKPLFYHRRNGLVYIASEIGALLASGCVPRRLDPDATGEFVANGYAVAPRTLLRDVRSVPAGTAIVLEPDRVTQVAFWDVDTIPVQTATPDIGRLRVLIEEAVESQLRADVPVGVFTSGGLDSSILAALAARRLAGRVTTFSIGFPDPRYDERRYARALARHLDANHIEAIADEPALREALDVLDEVGEPISDPAALPTLILARAAREHVTVVLSGEGGDELFGGYPTYLGHGLARAYGAAPAVVRRVAMRLMNWWPASTGRVPMRYLAHRFASDAARSWRDRHLRWFGPGLPDQVLAHDWRRPPARDGPVPDDVVGRAMRLDYAMGLRHRLLVKLDRAAMRASLETRAPYLDRRVTEAAFGLAGTAHVRGLSCKRVLRAVARPWVPRFILRRRKRGLSVPISGWLNGGLRWDLSRLLDGERLRHQGILDPDTVAGLLREHRARQFDHSRGLWTLYTFQRWLERWRVER